MHFVHMPSSNGKRGPQPSVPDFHRYPVSGDEPMVILDTHTDWRFTKHVRTDYFYLFYFITNSIVSFSHLLLGHPISDFMQERPCAHKTVIILARQYLLQSCSVPFLVSNDQPQIERNR